MTLYVFKKLGFEDVKPTNIMLQLVKRSLAYLKGVIEDILVKVDKFIFLADFMVLNMKEDQSVPIILGCPIFTIGQAFIHVCNRGLTLWFNSEEVKFSIADAISFLWEANTY